MFNNIGKLYYDILNSYILSNYNDADEICSDEEISENEDIDTDESEITLIAHRGYSSEAPENTIPAIVLAAENGYTTVECDIEWTEDSVPVLLHDKTINRTARKQNGFKFFFKKFCSDYTYEELQKFDFGCWMSSEYKGTTIPTFYEALECSEEYGLNLYVEIKETDDFNEEKAQILADAVIDAGLEDSVTWISFNSDYLEMMSEIMPESRLGYLTKNTPNEETIEILESLKTDSNTVFLDVKAKEMTDEADDLLDEAGFDFEAWTVDDEELLDKMYSYGCSGITTNVLTNDDIEECLNSSDYD